MSAPEASTTTEASTNTPVIELRDVHKRFAPRPDLAERLLALAGRPLENRTVHAVNGVSLAIARGEVVGLVVAANRRWVALSPGCTLLQKANCAIRANGLISCMAAPNWRIRWACK